MARLKVFVVFDSKVEAYMQPFFCKSVGEAERSWISVCNDGKSMMSTHPKDFTLFQTAEFDEASGRFEQLPALVPISNGVEAKSKGAASSDPVLPFAARN